MITKPSKNYVRKRVHARVRKKISGTETKPRLNVYRSNKNIYAQLIDDQKGHTLVSANSNEKGLELDSKSNKEAAKKVGTLIAERAIDKVYKELVIDSIVYLYQSRVD